MTNLRQWVAGLEGRFNAWTVARLPREDRAEAIELNRQRTWGYWLRAALMLCLSTAVAYALWPKGGWSQAFLISFSVWVVLINGIAFAWFSYRYLARNAAWKISAFSITLLLVSGLSVTLILPAIAPEIEVTAEKLLRVAGLMVLIGAGFSSLLVSVSRMRVREMDQRAARMQAENDRERLARQQVQAELKVLQAQVEPHFLFNTLANVRHLVRSGSPDALIMLDHLVHYLRTAVPEMRSDSSTLGRETELARAYLEIIRMRMGGGLQVEIDVAEGLDRQPFPPLMLMTLIENAVKHGIAPLGKGRISVRASSDGGCLRVSVEDDGRGLAEPIGQGVGLGNVRERLRAIYGDAARLDLAGGGDGGTVAVIEVPL
jgi:LytS/YehU family sensor histidine kinase